MIHVHQCFNAVGHGTFFSGLVLDKRHTDSFSWIYDCGSKRTTRIDQEITSLESWKQWPAEVDLLVLSHFDDDHVNGVERLLRSTKARVLALPYMDVDVSKTTAKLTLLSGTEKQEVELKASGDKLEALGNFKVSPGTKVVAVVSSGGKQATARFVLK